MKTFLISFAVTAAAAAIGVVYLAPLLPKKS